MQKLVSVRSFALTILLLCALWATLDNGAAVRHLSACQIILTVLIVLRAPLELVRPGQGSFQQLKIQFCKSFLGGLLLGLSSWTAVVALDHLSSRVTVEQGVVTDCQTSQLSDRRGNLREVARVVFRLEDGRSFTEWFDGGSVDYRSGDKLQVNVRRGVLFESIAH
ncbi:hypothetical protein JST97_18845 [bacterium]|nr:hypothetical protein [bacterium]